MKQSEQTISWPAGVIARALTRNGAHIDVTQQTSVRPGSNSHRAACSGCGRDRTEYDLYSLINVKLLEWADLHATTCTFLPRPDGGA